MLHKLSLMPLAFIIYWILNLSFPTGFQVKNNAVYFKSCNEGDGCHIVRLKLNAKNLHIFSSSGYAKDGEFVYYQGSQLIEADPNTFSVIDHC